MKTKLRFMAFVLLGIMLSVNQVWGAVTEELTNAELKSKVTNTTCAYATAKNCTDGTVSYVFFVYTDAANRPWVQLKKEEGVYIKITSPEESIIKNVAVTITSTSNSKGGVDNISMHTAYSSAVILSTKDGSGSTSMTGAVGSTTSITNNVASISATGSNNELYLKVASGARIWGVSVTYESASTKTAV